ncbi:hypothetical protein Hanom_Chr11g01030981 [Helianthus anomalus]
MNVLDFSLSANHIVSKLSVAYKISKRKTVDILQSLLSTHCSFQQKCKVGKAKVRDERQA